MRNFGDKIDNTAPLASGILTALEDNTRFKELENAVSTTGIVLDGPTGADTDDTMLAQAQARYASGGIMCQDGGAANAYVLTSVGSFVLPKAYFNGMMVGFYPAYENTSASTVNVASIGSKPIYDADGITLSGGEILANRLMVLVYSTSLNGGNGGFKMAPWTGLYITQPITKTVHGASPDFDDLYDAVDWLSRRIITREGSVTFSIAAGQYTYSDPLILNHPNLDRVTFQGAALLTAGINNSTFAVTGVAQTLDNAAHLVALRAVYGTELRLTTINGYIYALSKRPTFSRLLVTSDGSAVTLGALIQCEDSITTSNVSVHGSGDHGIIVRSGMMLVSGPTSASGCAGPGIAISDGAGLVQIGNLHLCSNAASGLSSLGGSSRRLLGTLQASGNGSGIYAANGGSVTFAGASSVLAHNTTALYANIGSSITLDSAGAAISNATYGCYCVGGFIYARQSTFSSCTTAAVALIGATIDLTSSTGAGTTSPANDTVGNNNSLIIVAGTASSSGLVVTPPSQTIEGIQVGSLVTSSQAASGGSGPYTWTISSGAAPPGYILSSAGVWTGSATTEGTYSATVTATDSLGNTGSATYTWIITPSALQISPPSQTISGIVVGNPAFGALTALGGTAPYIWSVASGAVPTGYALSSGGTWSGVASAAGTFVAVIAVTDALSRTASVTYTWQVVAGVSAIVLAPASTTISGISVGAVGTGTFTASGGTAPYTYAVTAGALPTGFALSSAGVLSGTSSAAGTFTATITATDDVAATGSSTYTWIVVSSTITVTPAGQTISGLFVGNSVYGNQSATGGSETYIWSVASGSLPPGYVLSSGGTWSGTATTAGNYTATIRGTDTLGNYGEATYTWQIAAAAAVTTITVSPATQTISGVPVGAPVFGTQTASGGTAPYTWSVSSGALPSGYSLSSGGVWSGTATTPGTYTATIRATDSASAIGSATYTWIIVA